MASMDDNPADDKRMGECLVGLPHGDRSPREEPVVLRQCLIVIIEMNEHPCIRIDGQGQEREARQQEENEGLKMNPVKTVETMCGMTFMLEVRPPSVR